MSIRNPHCCLMLLLRLVIRNLNYWDSVSTLAGEVSEPGKTLPRALGGAVVLVISMYLFPLMVGLGITTDTDDWTLGYFSHVAEAVAGRWLVYLMVAAAAVSQLGQYQAEMSSDSYQLLVSCRSNPVTITPSPFCGGSDGYRLPPFLQCWLSPPPPPPPPFPIRLTPTSFEEGRESANG